MMLGGVLDTNWRPVYLNHQKAQYDTHFHTGIFVFYPPLTPDLLVFIPKKTCQIQRDQIFF